MAPIPIDDLHGAALEHLLQPEKLLERLAMIEALDWLPGSEGLQRRLEAANDALYAAARAEIAAGGNASMLKGWLHALRRECTMDSIYKLDRMDDIVSGVLQEREPEAFHHLAAEMVPFQPTPTRYILSMIAGSGLASSDVLLDPGSGLGRVSMLANILTGCRTIGIEIQPHLVTEANSAARRLNLGNVCFLEGDVRDADLGAGNVFHLFTPFTGAILDSALERLRLESASRIITLCTLGPCTAQVQRQAWLEMQPASSGPLHVFRSRGE